MGSNFGTCAYVGRTLSTELIPQLHTQIIETFNYITLRTRNVYPTQNLVAVCTQFRRSHWEWSDQFLYVFERSVTSTCSQSTDGLKYEGKSGCYFLHYQRKDASQTCLNVSVERRINT